MALPAFILGLILSTLLGAAFHLWRGGGGGHLLLYLILGWLGFWLGEYFGRRMEWDFFRVGTLHVGPAIFSGLLFLALGYWLSPRQPEKHPRRPR